MGILGFNRKRKFSRIKLSSRFWFGKCGTPGWVRTSGFQLRRLTLYPLSYGRKFTDDRCQNLDDRVENLIQPSEQVKMKRT